MEKDLSKQIVHTTSLFEVDESFDDSRFMRVRVSAMHSGVNRNGSSFSLDCILAAKDSFKNIPILADVREYTDDDGNTVLDYSGHSMHIEDDAFNEGENKMIYDEKVVGIIPETNNFEIVHDDSTGNDYVEVDALIFREYGNYAADILESRGGRTDVSMEISCDEVSYSAENKCLEVGKMTACACTLLGEDVLPGMAKAHAEVFSAKTDNVQEQLLKIMQELKESLDNYTKAKAEDNLRKEEYTVENDNEVVEEITEEEAVVEEEFSEDNEVEETPAEDTQAEESEVFEEEPIEEDVNALKYSISYGDTVREFSTSLSDIIYALSELVNDTYAEEGTYYGVDVYQDDKYVLMVDYMTGKAYKQSYKVKKDSYTLVGDRVPVKSIYVTEDEEKKLNDMRANYSSISEKLEKYEQEPQKMEILESEDYAQISETEDFARFKEQSAHFDMSIDEVKQKADEMLLSYAKSGNLNFAVVDKVKVESKTLPNNQKKASRYGTVFSSK